MKILPITLVLIVCSFCIAQDITGNLEGRIVDSTGVAIAGANIVTTSPSLQGTRGTASDQTGLFRLLYLPPGVYTVKINHVSFKPQFFEKIRIQLGKTSGLGTIRMTHKTVEMGETIVSAQRPLLDPASTTTGMNMLRENFEVLPIDRNYRSVAALLPHSNASYLGDEVNIAGASGSENRYFIDGSDVRDSYRGFTGTNLPYNFVREIQVKSGGYEPEYKSSLGGIINAITFSGGNDFSGQVFGFFTNNNFSNQPRIAETELPKSDYAQYDAGFVFGGPVLRDQVWFSLAYSPSVRNEEVKVPGFGFYPDRTISNPFAGKLTWKASKSLDLSATVLGDPTTEQAVCKNSSVGVTLVGAENPDFFLEKLTSGGYASVLDGKYVLSPRALLQASVSWKQHNEKYMPRTPRGWEDFWVFDAAKSTAAGGTGEKINASSTTVSAAMSATVNLGQHMLKAGMEYKEIELKMNNRLHCLNVWSDTSYLAYILQAKGTLQNRLPSFYLQDAWSLTDRITVSGGLRWDGIFIMAPNGKVAQSILGQFQPRLGCTFLPSENGKRKLFASVGRYADDLLMYGSSLYHLGGSQLGLAWNHDPRVTPTRYDASDADTAFYVGGKIAPEVKDLQGQYFDEVSLGYEHLFSPRLKFTTRGVWRKLGNILEDGEAPTGSFTFYFANPGSGPLKEYPKATREYRALEFTLEAAPSESFTLMASYVLSRNRGNWSGIFYQDFRWAMPNATPQFDFVEGTKNAEGLLPNDRTHVFKLHGSFRAPIGLTCGFSFVWESGTPLNEFGSSIRGSGYPIFLVPRGTAGRLPSVWDLNMRFSYQLFNRSSARFRPRLILDVFHIGSPRTVVQQDQWHYFTQDADGHQIDPNPTYGMPQRFQPPMSIRLGMELSL